MFTTATHDSWMGFNRDSDVDTVCPIERDEEDGLWCTQTVSQRCPICSNDVYPLEGYATLLQGMHRLQLNLGSTNFANDHPSCSPHHYHFYCLVCHAVHTAEVADRVWTLIHLYLSLPNRIQREFHVHVFYYQPSVPNHDILRRAIDRGTRLPSDEPLIFVQNVGIVPNPDSCNVAGYGFYYPRDTFARMERPSTSNIPPPWHLPARSVRLARLSD